jgi:hypothetical protein
MLSMLRIKQGTEASLPLANFNACSMKRWRCFDRLSMTFWYFLNS